MREKCPHCLRTFPDNNAVRQHSAAKHHNMGSARRKRNRRTRTDDGEKSMADIFVQAQIDIACGEPVEEWIGNMLP